MSYDRDLINAGVRGLTVVELAILNSNFTGNASTGIEKLVKNGRAYKTRKKRYPPIELKRYLSYWAKSPVYRCKF